MDGVHDLGGVAGFGVQRRHDAHRVRDERRWRRVALDRGGDHPETDGFGEHQRVAGPGAGVGPDLIGVDGSDDREAELGFGVVDGVTAGDDGPRGSDHVGAAVEHPGQQVEGEALAGPADEVEREERCAPHGVDVRERVRGRNAPPVVGVVDDRGEEVGGDDDRQVVT